MRVVVDANVYLSYLLHPQRPTAACQVVTHAIAGDFVLVFPKETAAEVRAKIREKSYFRERIDPSVADVLLSLIAEIAVEPDPERKAPFSSRDPKDQYLLDAATDSVEFLITGDRDLLVDAGVVDFALIVTPAPFLSLFESVPHR